jgi:hypothetical protein
MSNSSKCGYCVPCFKISPSRISAPPRSDPDDDRTILYKFRFQVCLTDIKCLPAIPKTNIPVTNIKKTATSLSVSLPNEFCLGKHPRSKTLNRFVFSQIPQEKLDLYKVCCKGCKTERSTNPEEPTKSVPCCDLLKQRVINVSRGSAAFEDGCFAGSFIVRAPYTQVYGSSVPSNSTLNDMANSVQDGIWGSMAWQWNDLMDGGGDQTESSYWDDAGNLINPRPDGVTPLLNSPSWDCCISCPDSCV